jgi:hypothetical protein
VSRANQRLDAAVEVLHPAHGPAGGLDGLHLVPQGLHRALHECDPSGLARVLGHRNGRQHGAGRSPQRLAHGVAQVALDEFGQAAGYGLVARELPLQQAQARLAKQERRRAVLTVAQQGHGPLGGAADEGAELPAPLDGTDLGQVLQRPDRAAATAVELIELLTGRRAVFAWVASPAAGFIEVGQGPFDPALDGGSGLGLAPGHIGQRLVALGSVKHGDSRLVADWSG